MILTVQVRLLPTPEQSKALRETLETANAAANRLSEMAWDRKLFGRFPMHKAFYRTLRDVFPLSSQIVCLIIGKVADSYKLDKKVQREFRKLGSIAYDLRVLSFQLPASTVSIWTIGGRERIPFVCGERQRKLLEFPHGESDLILRDRKWYLNVTVEVPNEQEQLATDCLGVDFGIAEIAADSDGNKYSGSKLNKVRHHNRALRRKLQRKGTKSAKRLLKKRGKKEQRFARDTNHVISRRIVSLAKRTNRAIAIEELGGIRTRVRARKSERCKLHSWAFEELGCFLAYKAEQAGVRLVKIDPAYTSQRCIKCGHTEKANRKTRALFVCKSCSHTSHADENSAINIKLKGLELVGAGAFNHPNAEARAYGKIHECSHLQSASL